MHCPTNVHHCTGGLHGSESHTHPTSSSPYLSTLSLTYFQPIHLIPTILVTYDILSGLFGDIRVL
jgi:hypothetical protein